MSGSQRATLKAAGVETTTESSSMETAATAETTATMEATTTEASSTTAVAGSPCCGTERHESGDANQ
jgi:hypothetical protein